TLFCLVDGEATSNAFPVSTSTTKTIGDLIDLIKVKFPDTFNGVDAKDLSLWRVTIPDSDDAIPIFVNGVPENEKKKLRATDKVSVFGAALPEDTIHIIVQRPPSGNATLFDFDVRLELRNTTLRPLYLPTLPFTFYRYETRT
ncbi:hypothetical protein F5H01DRAFT_276822, partial [Linnemannia elongata]